MIIPKCASEAFDQEAFFWEQFHEANANIRTLNEQMREVAKGPTQYSVDSSQSRFSSMSHRLGEMTKARDYWMQERANAIENLTRLGVGLEDCECGPTDTGLTVMLPAF